MEKQATPQRNSQTCTADLLTWTSEGPPPSSTHRAHHPSQGVSKVLFGGDITDEETESFYKRRPCSGYKLKEISGSNIFSAGGEDGASEAGPVKCNTNNRTSVRIVQQGANGKSQISFGTEEKIPQKTPTALTEVAKQSELSGNQETESDSKVKKQLSDAKSKELSGSDIFGPPIEVPPRSMAAAQSLVAKENKDMDEPAPRTVRTSVKVSNPAGGRSNIMFADEPVVNCVKKIHDQKFAEMIGHGIFEGETPGSPEKKIHDQKFAELTGNGIFKGGNPPGSPEKTLSRSKLREMNGSNIFSDGKAATRVCYGGVRKPPGGESSIRLF
ncbi:uncharacterized protein LOC132068462 [Lycium ferocissimum]|uniref:uncharacterized protein LOC132068462 n=1 Tax=Lycium ferocissimum TaxID=112874 RepID=UPI002816900A|nr:uncharacterized protein LOC132068462 [Lycium ferocissimum]